MACVLCGRRMGGGGIDGVEYLGLQRSVASVLVHHIGMPRRRRLLVGGGGCPILRIDRGKCGSQRR